MYRKYFKRPLDFLGALFLLIILSPLLLVVTVWLHFANKGAGAFFLQKRAGKDAKTFKVIKFKSMTDERGPDGNLLPDAQRLTKIGRFLRSTSIDELPQLINVLKGEMSFIGPRPLPLIYLQYYTDEEKKRHEVRGGVTGLAQVSGRNSISWEKKFEYDIEYIGNISFLRDVKILFNTIIKVIKCSNIGVRGNCVLEDFHTCRAKTKNIK